MNAVSALTNLPLDPLHSQFTRIRNLGRQTRLKAKSHEDEDRCPLQFTILIIVGAVDEDVTLEVLARHDQRALRARLIGETTIERFTSA
ncbi:MAG TPA: hypothetical protein DDZ88_04150 [Verrucomicrobiales bacterium]|nr:hypothetical protein [Verrucomicrobiales bacterium]